MIMASPWKLIIELEAGEDTSAARSRLLSIFSKSSGAELSMLIFDPQNPREFCVKGTGPLPADLKALQKRLG